MQIMDTDGVLLYKQRKWYLKSEKLTKYKIFKLTNYTNNNQTLSH